MLSFSALYDAFALINSVVLPTGNLGIMRSQMPQIDGPHQSGFIKWLAGQGVKSEKTQMPAQNLKLTQNEINKTKVFKLMQAYRGGQIAKWAPIIVSKDGFVIDGSHRFVAIYNIDKYQSMEVIRVDMPALQLVQLCMKFPGVKFRNHSDSKVAK